MSNTVSNKALKLKLNPTTSQYSQFLKSFGCERFVYNFYLAEKNSFYEKEIKPLGNDKKARNAVWKTFEETPLASHLQRQLLRKCKNSKNREKAKIKLARLEEHIANCRKDWIEKETLRLVNSYQLIGIENLSIQGMMKSSRNAKNYQDISWYTFVSKLEQKSQFRNCQVVKVNRLFASSQICSCCGFKNPDVQKLHLQRWTCPQCGNEHQRDENATLNIKAEAIRVLREPE